MSSDGNFGWNSGFGYFEGSEIEIRYFGKWIIFNDSYKGCSDVSAFGLVFGKLWKHKDGWFQS